MAGKRTKQHHRLSPLVISELSEEEELEFIKVYLEAYLNNVADDDTKVKYSSVLPDTADQIYSNFKTALKEECDRPLFVAVYTELWIYKDGCISVTSLDEMLAAFLKREEDRWLLCLDNHSNLLKDYVKLLALNNPIVQKNLDAIINKKTSELFIEADYITKIGEEVTGFYRYNVTLLKGVTGRYVISHEALFTKKATSRSDAMHSKL